MAEIPAPIIIKRIKKGGHGHHGGAWKVAFADFVTAMMAFFLLLWLLGSTTDEQKRGISDYFLDPAGQIAAMGASNAVIDMGGGFEKPAGAGDTPDQGNAENSQGEQIPDTVQVSAEALAQQAQEAERAQLDALKEQIEKAIDDKPELAQYKDQILLDITNEGLRIQIVDRENRPMFDSGSTVLKDYTRAILQEIVDVIDDVPNKVSVSGHTDQAPYSRVDGYSNWELSADRSNAARRELLRAGFAEEKVGRVVGMGSSMLFDPVDPFNPINRRISIVVMNRQTEEALMESGRPVDGVPIESLKATLESQDRDRG